MVRVLALYSDNPSLNATEFSSLQSQQIVLRKARKISEKEAVV